MQKKILYVITKSNFGGAQRYVYDLACSLNKEEFDVSVVQGGEGLLKEKLHSCGVKTIILPYFKRDIHIWNDIKTFFALVTIFKKERPDIIHLNSSKAGILGTLAGRITRVPRIIFTAHGWAFNEARPYWQKTILFVAHCLTVLLSHATIAVSEKTKKQIGHALWLQNKIHVVRNGIAQSRYLEKEAARTYFASKDGVLTNRFQKEKNLLWIGAISELHKTKGLIYAFEAIKNLREIGKRNIVFLVCGEGEEKERLTKAIKRFGLKNHVFLLGFVENASRHMKAFDIFLLPSISEGLPYTILEAGYAELPVIASAVGGIPEIIEDKKSGLLVKPKNSADISAALDVLLQGGDLRLKFGKNLFTRVQQQFSFETMRNKTLSLYKYRPLRQERRVIG